MYLTEKRIFFSINHVFSSVTGRRELEDFIWFNDYFPAVEIKNSHMLERANDDAAKLAEQWGKIGIGGSDAHALPSVGTAYTEVLGARDKNEFFEGLRNGQGRVAGESGCFTKLTRDVYVIAYEMMRENMWTRLLSPLAILIPGFTFWNYCHERMFARQWAPQILDQPETKKPSPLDLRAANDGRGVLMTMAQTVWGQIQSNDHRLMRKIHRWRAPRWFRILMIMLTPLGDGWLWYSIGADPCWYSAGPRNFWPSARPPRLPPSGIFLFRTLKHAQPPQAALRNRGPLLVHDSARRTTIHFRRDTPLLHLPSRFRWECFIPICKLCCWSSRC